MEVYSVSSHRRYLRGVASLGSSIPTHVTDSERIMENTQPMHSEFLGNPGDGHSENEPVERAAAGAHETVDKIADATHQAADTISEKGAQLQDLQEEWLKNLRGYMNEHPVKSVGIAIASGFLLSRLLGGR